MDVWVHEQVWAGSLTCWDQPALNALALYIALAYIYEVYLYGVEFKVHQPAKGATFKTLT